MNYREARAVFLETSYAHQAAWGRSGRKEDAKNTFEHQSIEALNAEVAECGPKLGTPAWYTAKDGKHTPDDCIAVLVHDEAAYERFIPSSMTMEQFQNLLTEEIFGFPGEDE